MRWGLRHASKSRVTHNETIIPQRNEAKLRTRPEMVVTVDDDQMCRLEAVERNLAILIEIFESQEPGLSQKIEQRRNELENAEAAMLGNLADTFSQ